MQVILWAWNDIESRLSELDEVTLDQVRHGGTGRSGPAITSMMAIVLKEHHDNETYASSSRIDSDLTAIKTLLNQHKVEIAEHKLEELECSAADKLKPNHMYRLKLLRSNVSFTRWEWRKAGAEILAAVKHTPHTENARINEALGHELLGEKEKAYSIADTLREEFPHSAKLLSVWVRTAPDERTYQELAAVVSKLAHDDAELSLALAMQSLVEGCFEDSRRHSERATELAADWPQTWFTLAQAKHSIGHRSADGSSRSVLTDAEALYSKALKLAEAQKMPGLQSAIRVNRASVRHLLGHSGTDADYRIALELHCGDGHIPHLQYVAFLLELDRHAEALSVLQGMKGEPDGARLFLEAAALNGRNVGSDREKANELWKRVIIMEPGDRWVHAHIHLVQSAVAAKTTSDAENVITASRLREIDPLVFHTLRSWLAHTDGKNDDAQAECKLALDSLIESTPREYVFLLAQCLVVIGQDESALPLLERSYRAGQFSTECRKLLDAAKRLNRPDVVCRVCRELREAGETDPRIVVEEIQTLQQYDSAAALKVAVDYLATHSDNRHVALWQSTLAMRLEKPELLIAEINRLPDPGEISPQATSLVMDVLTEAGHHAAALRYAYQSLRIHYADEFVHGQYVHRFLELSKHIPELELGGIVKSGFAVHYREDRSGEQRWLIIEDEPDPELERQEYAPDHQLSLELLGKRVSEAFVLPGGIQARTATVLETHHKYIYRFQDGLAQHQVRFPGSQAIQMINVGTPDGGFDFSPLVKQLEEQKQHIENLNQLYRSNPVTIFMFAHAAGHNEIEAWHHLASDSKLGIRCCNGNEQEFAAAVSLMCRNKHIVIDLIALHTLGRLQMLEVLSDVSCQFVVSETTHSYLRHLVETAVESECSNATANLVDGRLAYAPVSLEQRTAYTAYLRSLVDAVLRHCRVVACTGAMTMDPARRKELIELVGRHNLDSILLACEPDAVLWTDDLILDIVGRELKQTRRVWTQAALLSMLQSGGLTQQAYSQAVAKLVGFHYQGIFNDAHTLTAAAEIAKWNERRWPMPQSMWMLGDTMPNPVQRVATAALAIHAIWRRDLPRLTRQGFVFAVLAGLGSVRLIEQLIGVLPQLFSVDVVGADESRSLVRWWLQTTPTILRP